MTGAPCGHVRARVLEFIEQHHCVRREQVGKVEKFYFCLLDIKNLGNRLKALTFKARFDSLVAELLGKTSSFLAGSVALRDSRALRILLEHVLAIGERERERVCVFYIRFVVTRVSMA